MMPNETVYLPIIIDGNTRHISGVTKSTTCSDVIKKVHALPGVEQDDLHSLALFESSYGIERMLPGKTKILKVWRDWQTGTNNVRFVLRKAETAPKVSYAKRKMLHQRVKAARTKPYTMATSNLRRIFTSLPKLQECSKNKDVAVSKDQLDYIKEIYLKDLDENDTQHISKVGKVTGLPPTANCGPVKLARRKSITKLSRSSLYQQIKFAVTKNLGKITTATQQANREQTKSLDIHGLTEERVRHRTLIDGVPSHLSNQTTGKQDILRRYLDGYVPHRRSELKVCRRQLFFRDSGDGQEQTVYGLSHVQGDGTEVVSSPLPLSRSVPSTPSPIRRDLNLAFLDSYEDLAENMVSGHIEVQSGRDAVIRKQSRLIDDFVNRHGLVDYSGSEEEEDGAESYSRLPCNSASHLSSASETVHDRIASLLNTCIVNGMSEEELSSANSDDMSV